MGVSIQARNYLGENFLLIRSGPGVDQLRFDKVFPITEDECDFHRGRFTYFRYGKAPEDNQNFFIHLQKHNNNIEEIITWIGDNIGSWWCFDTDSIGSDGDVFWRFSFLRKEDATLFKLTWSGQLSLYNNFNGYLLKDIAPIDDN